MDYSRSIYGDALMSTFLGNHDVSRFSSNGADGSWAEDADSACTIADVVSDSWWYDRLELAFTCLLTSPGVPLIYYGDELGVPGYKDPDNRHPLWWYSSALNGGSSGEFDLQDLSDGLYHEQMGGVLWALASLGNARQEHPAFYSGSETTWWMETDIYGYARVSDDDQLLTILNRSWSDATLENSLSFAGLATEGTWEDILTGDTFTATSDWISIQIPANSARVLVLR